MGPQTILFEGNYGHNYKGDDNWGESVNITLFRNWISGHRASHPPLDTYYNTTDCGNGQVIYYGDYRGVAAVDVQAYSYNTTFVGNVLGRSGQALLTEPSTHGAPCNGPVQDAFVEQIWLNSQNSLYTNPLVMWQFGYDSTSGSVNGFVDTTIQTQIRTANYDFVTNQQKCFDKTPWTTIGNTTDQGCSGVPALPSSFYLSSKPAFFGSADTWPWVDPSNGTTYTLPAKYCFEHNQMPTCRQGT